MKFCEKLRLLREERGMSLAEFANLLHSTKQVLSRYERGENDPKLATVMRYADILNVPLSYLIYDEVTDRTSPAPKIATAPTEPELSEGEQMLIKLFRQIPPEQQPSAIEMLRSALKVAGIPQ